MRRLVLGVIMLTLIGCASRPEPSVGGASEPPSSVGGASQPQPSVGGATLERKENAPFPIQAEFPGSAADLDGDWLAVQNGDQLTAYNIKTGKSALVPTRGRLWGGFAVGGGKLVWADLRNDPHVADTEEQQPQPNLWNWDIMLMDLATGEVAPVTTDAASQWQPHTDGHNIVWEDFRHDTTRTTTVILISTVMTSRRARSAA